MTLGNYIANIQTDIPWLPGWLIAVTLFFALLAAGFALQYLIMKVLASYHVGKSPLSQSVFRRTKAVVRYAFCLLAVKIALPLVPLPAEAAQAVHNLTAAAFVVLLGWIMIIATNTIADRYALRLKLDGDDTLLVRKAVTQIRILRRAAGTLIILVTIGLALMNFESVRQFGVSLFASAGIKARSPADRAFLLTPASGGAGAKSASLPRARPRAARRGTFTSSDRLVSSLR